MSVIENIYADLDTEVTEEEFRDAVTEKVDQMGGLADEETAAKLVAHELGESDANTITDIDPEMSEVTFLGKVTSIGELRTFERDDSEGHVLNIECGDETGRVRVALWDEDAVAGTEDLETGQVLRIKGHPKEGYNGLEVSASRVEGDPDAEIDVTVDEAGTIDGLSLGQSDITLTGRVLAIEPVRTFSRDDGSEGRVSNLVLGDETGRVRVTLWDEQADSIESETIEEGVSVEVIDGYVRERDGTLEVHIGSRGAIEPIDEDVRFVPDAASIETLEIGQTTDIAGVIRSTDPKRTFERDDGSDGQVRNVRVQDQTGDIRVALWGEKADIDLGPGDEALFADVEIQEGWKDSIEASAGWQSTVSVLDDGTSVPDAGSTQRSKSDLGSDASGTVDTSGQDGDRDRNQETEAKGTLSSFASNSADQDGSTTESERAGSEGTTDEYREFTGTVVQTGDPVMLDDGNATLTVITDADVRLGEEVTVRGRMRDRDGDGDGGGTLEAEDVL